MGGLYGIWIICQLKCYFFKKRISPFWFIECYVRAWVNTKYVFLGMKLLYRYSLKLVFYTSPLGESLFLPLYTFHVIVDLFTEEKIKVGGHDRIRHMNRTDSSIIFCLALRYSRRNSDPQFIKSIRWIDQGI